MKRSMKRAGCFLTLVTAAALAGCSSDYEQLAPEGVVAMHGDEPMTLQAPADGQLSIYDQSIENLIYSGHIRKGQLVVVDPVNKQVTVNGMAANTKPLFGGDTFKIHFSPNP
jgi:hypothetical protein